MVLHIPFFRKKQKKTGALAYSATHKYSAAQKQRKYFSLMLIPSHKIGKTWRLRIPYFAIYAAASSLFVVAAVVLAFYLRSLYYQNEARQISGALDKAQEAYNTLQEDKATIETQLQDESDLLLNQLTDEQRRFQTERNQQRQDYQATLDEYQEMILELERQLLELETLRQSIIEQLSNRAVIPHVQTFLAEFDISQREILADLRQIRIKSDERNPSVRTTSRELDDYISLLTIRAATQMRCFEELATIAVQVGPYSRNFPTIWPVYGEVSSGYGYRTDTLGGGGGEFHTGIDIRCPTGTEVKATGGGTVTFSGWDGDYGYVVIIDHGLGLDTLYAHNSKLLAEVGQRVERGDIISLSGNTGRSSGPHVHYTVRVNGSTVNPVGYLLE